MSNDSESRDLTFFIKTILYEYESYNDIKNKISFDEYHNKNLLPSLRNLITDSQFKNNLGESNIDSLNKLLINIKEKLDVYRHSIGLGNDDDARKEKKEVLLIDVRITQKLESILEGLLLKGKNAPNVIYPITDNDKLINDYETKKQKVFISYARRDAGDWARVLYDHFIELGYDVFIDIGIKAGDDWSNVIENNISECDIFIPIITSLALRKPEVEKEILLAQKLKKRIVPCIYKNLKNDQIKWKLNSLQSIKFVNEFELVRNLTDIF